MMSRLKAVFPKRIQLASVYRQINGTTPNLRQPRLLSERILHRILWDRDPLLRIFCDKIAAKEWIGARIGPGHTPRTLAVADRVEALLAMPLLDRWMLKATHGSGWYQLVASPTHPLDEVVLEQARQWLNVDYADIRQEWGYRNLPRRLMAEELLSFAGDQCTEVSAFCFRGRVAAIRVYRVMSALLPHRAVQAARPRTKECFLDGSLNPLPLVREAFEHDPGLTEQSMDLLPSFLPLARELSASTPFLRVDGYLSDRGVQIGELTPYPAAGIGLKMPRPWDAWLGAFWD